MVQLELPFPILVQATIASVRSSRDVLNRCWYSGGIYGLNSVKIAALMFAAGQPGIAPPDYDDVAGHALRILSGVYRIDRTKFRGNWLNTLDVTVRMTLLDLEVLFGFVCISGNLPVIACV